MSSRSGRLPWFAKLCDTCEEGLARVLLAVFITASGVSFADTKTLIVQLLVQLQAAFFGCRSFSCTPAPQTNWECETAKHVLSLVASVLSTELGSQTNGSTLTAYD